MKNIEKIISAKTAQILLDKKCIEFSLKKKFQLTSGKKSIIYCDCRKLISFPVERNLLMNFALKKLNLYKSLRLINNIAGGESAGIPYASFISQKLNLPLSYIRKKKKKFGKKAQIEGIVLPDDKVLLVEDLMTDGGSKFNFIKAIQNESAKVIAIFVIFNYGINHKYLEYKGKKIRIISLTTWSDVIKIIKKEKVFKNNEINEILKFLNSMNVKNLKFSP